MPRLIDFGPGLGVKEYPDDATDEQIVADHDALTKTATVTAGDVARQATRSFLRGTAGMVATVPESLAITASALTRKLGPLAEGEPTAPQERSSYQLGQKIRQFAEDVSPAEVPALKDSFWASTVPEGLGSTVGFMAGGAAGRLLKVPQWLSIAGLGAAAGQSQGYEDAKEHGADEDTAQLSGLLNGVVGTSEAFPLARMMKRLDRISGGTFSKVVLEAGKDTLEEALQEGVQQLAGNATARALYDQDRSLLEDVGLNAGAGGVTGFLASLLTQGLGHGIHKLGEPSRMRRGQELRRDIISNEVQQGRLLPQTTGEPNAESTGTTTIPGGEAEALREGQDTTLRVRNPSQDGLEAQAGALNLPPAPVTFQSYSPGFGKIPGFGLYNIQEDISPQLTKGSTVSEDTLNKAGFSVPVAEKSKAAAASGNPATPQKTNPAVEHFNNLLDDYEASANDTLEGAIAAAHETAKLYNPQLAKALELIKPYISGLNQTVTLSRFNDGNYYALGNVNLTRNNSDPKTALHEAVHALSSNYIVKHVWQDKFGSTLRGADLLAQLNQRLADPTLPQPARDIINIYLSASKQLKMENTLFKNQPAEERDSRPFYAKQFGGGFTIYIAKPDIAKQVMEHLHTLVDNTGVDIGSRPTSTGGVQLTLSPEGMFELMRTGHAKKSATLGEYWVALPFARRNIVIPGAAGMASDAFRAPVFGLPYGMANLDEFLAEAFSNRDFQELLHRLPSDVAGGRKSLWTSFVEWVKSILPFFKDDPTILTEILSVGEQIFGEAVKMRHEKITPMGFKNASVANPSPPQFFETRQQVEAAVTDPLLKPAQVQAARDLAAVQSSMTSDNTAGNIFASPKDDAELFAQKKLEYLLDRRFTADTQKWFKNLPETTDEEKQAKEVAASVILGHYGVDRQTERQINSELESDQLLMQEAVKKIGKVTNAQAKANFLTAMFNRLTKDYRTYLNNLAANIPATQNAQSQYRQRLADAERRLNEQVQSPVAVQHALSAIATNAPDNLLVQGTTNQALIQWALQSNVLNNVVSQHVRDWMLVDDGSGNPALEGYSSFIADMASLRDVLNHQATLSNDIRAFEQWFKNSQKTGKVPPKTFAEKYFKFRTDRDRAAKLAAAMDKEIGDLDTRIRGNTIASRWLQEMMTSPNYVQSVRGAAEAAHVVVRAIHEGQLKTGLIERDKTVGLWRLKGPTTGTEYIVDLHPSATAEAQNQGNLKSFAIEARDYAANNADTDPLLSDEYDRLADYIDRFMVHPALNPNQGFTQLPWIGIPGTTIRLSTDPYGWTAKTIRDVLEKVGGRTARQAVLDANELDTVMRKVDGINNNKTYGYAAQTQAVLKAIKSHGWEADQFPQWDERVAERLIAAGQNNLGPNYEVGDVIVGSGGVRLTAADMEAVRIMKQWEDAVLRAAPKHIQDRIGDLGILRKAIASGRWAMARTEAPWVHNFMVEWDKAGTDADKWRLLDQDTRFRRVVMGYIGEFNPEFQKMNKADKSVTKFYDIFRLMARYEKDGVQNFANVDQVLDFMAHEMVSQNMAPDEVTARNDAKKSLMSDMKSFIESFKQNVSGRKEEDVWGAVPPPVVQAASARNSFTIPRGNLVAPSTFYNYSRASDGSRAHYVGSLRSLMNLKLLQSSYEMRRALEAAKARMQERADELVQAGMKRPEAMKQMIKETTESRKSSELRFDYLETVNALSLMEKAFDQLARFEQSTTEHYQHGGVAALLNVFGTLKTSLLSSVQAVSTNYWSGVMLGPAIVHVQTGRLAKAITDFVLEPHFFSTLFKRMSAMVAGNPTMSRLLNQHAPLWSWMARNIVDAAEDWRRVEEIAIASGMVSPYNISDVLKNKKALKTTAGRLESEEEVLKRGVAMTNYIMSQGGVRHVIESAKATTPRFFDNLINYTLITAFDHETDFLKKMGWTAFKNREEQAARTGTDYTNLSDANNILQPGDLGLRSWKALNRYREMFAGLGSLDHVLLDFYERTKNMTAQQRRDEPLIKDISDHAAAALQYAAITNVATESNRPYLFKGKGSDGMWRNVAGTFMGWPINMAKQLSKVIQTHSKDPKFEQYAGNMLALAALTTVMALGGAWNWEFGDELAEKLYNQSSARIQLGNVLNAAKQGDWQTAGLYFVQALVNTVPYIGPQLGNLLGVAYTGRGNIFDATSWNPVLGWVADSWNTSKRVAQTGDITLPMADYVRRWVPLSRIVINRLPVMSGLVDQQNAVRSLNASAPPGVEIKWGQKGGGPDARYSPANDEIQRLVSAAYDVVARGGTQEEIQRRYQEAIDAYVKTGKTEDEAKKLVAASLASKEPIRILIGREMTPDEETKWKSRMTPEQTKDYQRALDAWKMLGDITGKDLNMVREPGGGGGGGGFRGGLAGIRPAVYGSTRTRTGRRSLRTRLLRSGSSRLRAPRIGRRASGRGRLRSRRLI